MRDPYRLWEVLGTWASAAATFGAVIVSLWLASRQSRPRLRVWADKRILISGISAGTAEIRPADFPDKLVIDIANTGAMPVKVVAIGWLVRLPRPLRWLGLSPRRSLYQNPPESGRVPIDLAPAQYVNWLLEPELPTAGIAELLAASALWPLWMRYLRVQASTSVDTSARGKLGPELRADILERVKKIRNSQRQTDHDR